MWNDFKNFLTGTKRSRETAKGRLHLVLAHDRAGLDGGKLQEMRSEIVEVLSKYVEIDVEAVEIEIERVTRQGSRLRVSGPLRSRAAQHS